MSQSTNKFQDVSNRTLRVGVLLLFSMLSIGTLAYMYIEKYSLIDAFFMTIITISTVGFSEVHPLSDIGKIFTSGLIITSLGSLAYVGSNLARFVFDGELVNYLKTYRVDKKIQKLKDHVIIIGFGRNGEQVAMELMDYGIEFVIIDKRDNVISRIRDNEELLYIRGDATHEDVLKQAGVDHARALIATTPNDADNVFVALTARSMNPSLKIVSRASEMESVSKLKRAGVTNVIMPERIGGQRMAKLITQPDVVEFLEYILLQHSKDVSLEEISCTNMADCFVNHSIEELRSKDISGINIVGIKISGAKYIFNPSSELTLSRGDQLFVLGSPEQIKRFRHLLERG
ncbi:potassium channel family protein [Mangrovibacterium diazotrophicum]|uniref:Trk system potassium uptake protein TrkA n=1 Tax=Mangrovibacterium diazotrophicum TaxID=1261403 RepID=A0A419WBB6_9BACT|nr:potassium channel protein [Mangrovibacterium diazotrophicum]RKD92747.1 voltage-gated potassium channel [Mangrovibacterium diazotrophicum]